MLGQLHKESLHILGLVHSDPDVVALGSSRIKLRNFNNRAHIVLIALDDLDFVTLLRAGRGESGRGLFGRKTSLYCTLHRVHASEVHICKRGQYLLRLVKIVRVLMGLPVLYDDTRANDDKITAFLEDKGVVVPLALQSAVCIVCTLV